MIVKDTRKGILQNNIRMKLLQDTNMSMMHALMLCSKKNKRRNSCNKVVCTWLYFTPKASLDQSRK